MPPTRRPRWAIALAAVVLGALALLAGRSGPTDAARVGPEAALTGYGVQVWSVTDSGGIAQAEAIGAHWLRVPVYWYILEPNPGKYSASALALLDAQFARAAEANMRVLATIRDAPSWAASVRCGPLDRVDDRALADTVAFLVARYGQAPYHVHWWELYNEPDNERTTPGWDWLGGCWGARGGSSFAYWGSDDGPVRYARMLRAVYPALRAAHPDARLVLGGLAGDWYSCSDSPHTPTPQHSCDPITPNQPGPFRRNFLERVLEAGGGPYFDIANFHYYSLWRLAWEEESLAFRPNIGQRAHPLYGHDIAAKAAYYRTLLANAGYPKPIIVTEAGAWSNPQRNYGSTTWQGYYAAQLYVRSIAAQLDVVFWYELLDGADCIGHGLYIVNRPNCTPTPQPFASPTPKAAATAYRVAVETLASARAARRMTDEEIETGTTEAYEFTGMPSGINVIVAWSAPPYTQLWPYPPPRPEPGTTLRTVTLPGAPLSVRNHLGAPVGECQDPLVAPCRVPGGPSYRVVVDIGPVYVEVAPTEVTPAPPTATSTPRPVVVALTPGVPTEVAFDGDRVRLSLPAVPTPGTDGALWVVVAPAEAGALAGQSGGWNRPLRTVFVELSHNGVAQQAPLPTPATVAVQFRADQLHPSSGQIGLRCTSLPTAQPGRGWQPTWTPQSLASTPRAPRCRTSASSYWRATRIGSLCRS